MCDSIEIQVAPHGGGATVSDSQMYDRKTPISFFTIRVIPKVAIRE
jgi:hypothetical protein